MSSTDSNVLLYAILTLNAVLLILNITFLFRLKLIKYLLEQPVVKKVTSSTKLKPYKSNRGKQKDKSSGRLRSHQKGRDSRQDRGQRSDKNRGNERFQRGRSGKPEQTRNAAIAGNAAAEKEGRKREPAAAPKKPAPDAESKPAEPAAQPRNNASAPAESSPAPQPSKPEPKGEESKAVSKGEAIQHGRRTKVKKTPTFEE